MGHTERPSISESSTTDNHTHLALKFSFPKRKKPGTLPRYKKMGCSICLNQNNFNANRLHRLKEFFGPQPLYLA